MIQVTKEQFFAKIGALNVHPEIINAYEHQGRGYIKEWRMLSTPHTLIGTSESGDPPFTEKKFFLAGKP